MPGTLVNSFRDSVITGDVFCEDGFYTVKGYIHYGMRKDSKIIYRAPEPADLRMSIAGSGLPFPNQHMAFGEHPDKANADSPFRGTNSGVAEIDESGYFSFNLISPNSFYLSSDLSQVAKTGRACGHGKVLVQPILYIDVVLSNGTSKNYEVDLGKGINLRSLTNYPGKPIRSTGRNNPTHIY